MIWTKFSPKSDILLIYVLVETAVEAPHVGVDDRVLGLKQCGLDQTLDAIVQQGVVNDRLILRLGNLQHDRLVWTLLGVGRSRTLAVGKLLGRQLDLLLGLIIWGMVGEDRLRFKLREQMPTKMKLRLPFLKRAMTCILQP